MLRLERRQTCATASNSGTQRHARQPVRTDADCLCNKGPFCTNSFCKRCSHSLPASNSNTD
eukprot:7125495-Alexandrium_andersonii.AAC.1